MKPNLEKINEILALLQNDTITPKQLEQFLQHVLYTVKQTKDKLVEENNNLVDNISKDFHTKIQEALSIISEKANDNQLEVRQLTNKQKKVHEEMMSECESLLNEIKSIEIKNGVDGRDGSPDTPDQIRDKLQSLKDENRLDASSIKNLPKSVETIVREVGTFGQVETPIKAGSNISITTDSTGAKVISSTGSGGSSWGSITGTLSNQTDLQTALDAKLDGNGVATYIPFYSDANTLTSEADFNYDSVNHRLHVHAIAGDATDGLLIESDNGTDIGILGAANTANVTWYGNHNFNTATQDTIAGFTGAGKTLGSLATATYPSLTELSYVKGVTSAIQTQLNGKGDVTADDTSTTAQNIVAYSGAGGKNITELTGTQGDILYHNGTSWAKLGAGTVGQYLETGGSGANPSWGYGAVVHVSTSSGATTTGADTNPVSVSGAVFTYAANATYRIWVMGRINSTAATTGIGIQFDVSTAITAINVQFFHQLASTGTLTGGHSIADAASVGVSSGVPAGPIDVPFTAFGLLVPGNNTGTCQLQLRAEVAAVTELLAGTTMVVERIA